ncbi:MAG: adenylate/guanylate cyclase domain-containing protein [Candidatus Riflebacteria bacterium]|nr:adenylate/guanylate cyclase domain-containing protein [Candidatus Riflebacteria bacterium]
MPLGKDRCILQSKALDERAGLHLIIQRSLEEALLPFYRLQRILALVGLAGLAVTLVGGALIARSVSRPVLQLAESARKVQHGDFEARTDIGQDDEIGELAGSFNRMVAGLQERDRIRSLLGKVVSSDIAEELLKSPEIRLGGEEREVTVLFSDIRDFTTLCEGRSPAVILDMLNRYLTRMNDVIESQGGVVDKFIGDAIMAIFGAPLVRPDHVDRALRAALEMVRTLAELQNELAAEGFPEIRIGIGINTDVVVAGNMGSRDRLNYTVIGDGVNLASRLESQCKTFKTPIIVSEKTLQRAGGGWDTRPLGEITVKGKSEPTRIHALIGEGADRPEQG